MAPAFVELAQPGGCRMSEQNQKRSEESLRHEYNEVGQNIRHYQNLRFAILSVFIAMMAGVGLVAFGKGQFSEHAAVGARAAGVLLIAVFWLYEERQTEFLLNFRRVAIELERALGYTQWTRLPIGGGRLVGTRILWRLFFFPLALLWLYGLIAVPLG